MKTLNEVYKELRDSLSAARVNNPALDARIFIRIALEIDETAFIASPDMQVAPDKERIAKNWAARRMAGEPVSRILGAREFWGMEFKVTPDTLDPRPDTEILVESAVAWAKHHNVKRILDLGTGTGCVLLSILKELPEVQGVGVDLNPGAINVSRENGFRLGFDDRATFRQGDWFGALAEGERFDLIVANPPYIPESDIESLAKEVKNHDPILALAGGIDGLEPYKILFAGLHKHLIPTGRAFFEFGFGQGEDIARLVDDSHLFLSRIIPDLAGIPRVAEIHMGKT